MYTPCLVQHHWHSTTGTTPQAPLCHLMRRLQLTPFWRDTPQMRRPRCRHQPPHHPASRARAAKTSRMQGVNATLLQQTRAVPSGAGLRPVPAQMWQGVRPVPARMWAAARRARRGSRSPTSSARAVAALHGGSDSAAPGAAAGDTRSPGTDRAGGGAGRVGPATKDLDGGGEAGRREGEGRYGVSAGPTDRRRAGPLQIRARAVLSPLSRRP